VKRAINANAWANLAPREPSRLTLQSSVRAATSIAMNGVMRFGQRADGRIVLPDKSSAGTCISKAPGVVGFTAIAVDRRIVHVGKAGTLLHARLTVPVRVDMERSETVGKFAVVPDGIVSEVPLGSKVAQKSPAAVPLTVTVRGDVAPLSCFQGK
jgi:hypothetical protein